MKKEQFYELLGEIDEDTVKEAEDEPSNKPKFRIRYGVAAAVLLFTVIGAVAWYIFSGRLSKDSSSSKENTLPQKVVRGDNGKNNALADRIIFDDLPTLMSYSRLIVIGEYAEDTEQETAKEYSDEFGKKVVTDIISTNKIHIKKVLKGDPPDEDIKISQRYGVQNGTDYIITFSDLTPMVKGDEWLFFLDYDNVLDTYWCVGDYCGRYPVPNDEIKAELEKIGEKGLLDKETLGVYSDSANNTYLYRDIIEYFGDALTE